jgi:translocator protein
MTPADTQQWYAELLKPWFAPPSWIFGPVWSVLYVLIAISFGYVFWKIIRKELPMQVGLPFVLNLVANAFFTPIQFGLQNNLLAFFDILIVLVTITWIMNSMWSHIRWISFVQVPYLLWVSFATILQASITWLNQ